MRQRISEQVSNQIKELYDTGMRLCDISRKLDINVSTAKYHVWDKEKKQEYAKKRREEKLKLYKKDPSVRERNNKKEAERRDTRHGRILALYHTMGKRNRKWLKEKDPRFIPNIITRDAFFKMVDDYEKKYGAVCFYERIPYTYKAKEPNTMSIERFDSSLGYTKSNIVFSGWDFNNRKNNFTTADCFIVVARYLETNYPEDFDFLLKFQPGLFSVFMKKFNKQNTIGAPRIKTKKGIRMSYSQGGLVGGDY